MDTSRWQSIREIFHACLDQAPAERISFLARECRGNRELRLEVERLLADVNDTDHFLEPPSSAIDRLAIVAAPAAAAAVGSHIGPYLVRGVLGVGGMGVVYEAEQASPQRTVALKLIRPGVASPDALRRFQHEAQVLGRLQHRGIAQVYEAGTAVEDSERRPYFAMELVRGDAITRYAARRSLKVRDRLLLVAEVCDAIEHAHQKGVIHRDLKPGNVLVDERGQPRVLDFGVARVTDSGIASATLTADVSQIVGTLSYMSPEQAEGSPLDLDTRSDVYSLGVICYELLSGRVPYSLAGKPLLEAVRVIREQSPAPLGSVRSECRGDLETIVAKAIEKDRRNRYQSAAALRDDIHRFLRNEPILARPPSRMYRVRKFVRRNRTLVLAVAGVCAALLAGLAGTGWQAYRATQSETRARELAARESAARAKAQSEADRSTHIKEFLQDMLLFSARAPGQDVEFTVREALDKAADRIKIEFAEFPETRAELHATLAGAYQFLGRRAQAEEHLMACIQLTESLRGTQHRDLVPTLLRLGIMLRRLARYGESESVLERARTIIALEYGETSEEMAGVLNSLGLLRLRQGDTAGAEHLLQQSLQIKQTHGAEVEGLVTGMINLSLAWAERGDLKSAEARVRDALALLDGLEEDRFPRLRTNAINNLARFLIAQRRYAEALPLFESVTERSQDSPLGQASPHVISSRINTASCLVELDQLERAYDIAEAVYSQIDADLLENYPALLHSIRSLGSVFARLGEIAPAEALLHYSYEQCCRVYGPEAAHSRIAAVSLARLYVSLGRESEAEPLLRDVLGADAAVSLATNWRTAEYQRQLGECLAELRRFEEAELLLALACDGLRNHLGDGHRRTIRAATSLARLYDRCGRDAEAKQLREKLHLPAAFDDNEDIVELP